MTPNIQRRPLNGRVRTYEPLENEAGDLLVWSYGGIAKNTRAGTVPLVVVFFRRLGPDGRLGTFVRKTVALTHLGLLRVGTIWHQGVCTAEAIRETRKFELDFTEGAWNYVCPYECARQGLASPICRYDYPLYFNNDRNWWLNFSLPSGDNLLIPCTEFLIRCYGRSEEVPRVLATYPWHEVERRFYAPFNQPIAPETWPIKLTKRLYNEDAVFLAHAKYDEYAHHAAKRIYSQIEAAFKNDDSYAFIQVAPWFQGQAGIKVEGIRINEGKTFLGLRIRGGTEPLGETIQRDRESSNKTRNPAEGSGVGKAWAGAPGRVLRRYPDITNLTDVDEPDHGASTLEVEEEEFEIFGERRTVIDVWRDHAKTSAGKRGDGGNPKAFSSGEPYGKGKEVGHASIHANTVLESQGALRDMWNAMRRLKMTRPDLIRAVEWFTFDKGFRSEGEPTLVSLTPFNADLDVSTRTRNWLYYDIRGKVPRGILIARILTEGKVIHIVEIQRKPTLRNDEDGEEAFRGLVFQLNDPLQFEDWLQKLLSSIRYARGVLKKLESGCPGTAKTFKHPPARNGGTPCEAALANALAKVGITV